MDNCVSSEPAFSWEEMYYDGLGRKIKTMREGPDGLIVGETNIMQEASWTKRLSPILLI